MKIEDVNIDHIRRGAVITVKDGWETITSIPVGFVDRMIEICDTDLNRWHDKEKCSEILQPYKNLWQSYYPLCNEYTFVKCFGQCVPNQKIIPWNKDRFIQAHYTWIHAGYKTKRTVKFASGDEVSYYKEDADD